MKYGFFKVAAASPALRVADVKYNTEKIIDEIILADRANVKLLVFPKKCITGATIGDLSGQRILEDGIKNAVSDIARASEGRDIISVLSFPSREGHGFTEYVCVQDGKIIARSNGKRPIILTSSQIPGLSVAVCSARVLSKMPFGAAIIACPDAEPELVGHGELKETIIRAESIKRHSAVIYANAGEGESSTDFIYAGRKVIYEDGRCLAKSGPFGDEIIITDIDLERLPGHSNVQGATDVVFGSLIGLSELPSVRLHRSIPQNPFLPADENLKTARLAEIFELQARGLKRRMEHIRCKTAVIGVSGGLDSTLALLVVRRAYELMDLDPSGIMAVTMPCFGTSGRTYKNALKMMQELGVTAREINIKDAVMQHLKDIDHDPSDKNVAFENAQARERTQVLMDICNDVNGMVIGTGDLSELALGFATYNGDHMSMYGVNGSIPKTLVRELVRFLAENAGNEALKACLLDVVETPVSPELLPADADGGIAQKTENIVGPYELHDFFIYHVIKYGFRPSKILRLAAGAFDGIYDTDTIKYWLKTFLKRFFAQQFKRSCLPDGVAVGSIGLSPREGFKMPSDAISALWLQDIN